MNGKTAFEEVVSKSADLPTWVKNNLHEAHGVKARILDQSYLDFLDGMIAREPRGPEWTEILKRRKFALSSFRGKSLVSGFVNREGDQCLIKFDPDTRRLLFWEVYPYADEVT